MQERAVPSGGCSGRGGLSPSGPGLGAQLCRGYQGDGSSEMPEASVAGRNPDSILEALGGSLGGTGAGRGEQTLPWGPGVRTAVASKSRADGVKEIQAPNKFFGGWGRLDVGSGRCTFWQETPPPLLPAQGGGEQGGVFATEGA